MSKFGIYFFRWDWIGIYFIIIIIITRYTVAASLVIKQIRYN